MASRGKQLCAMSKKRTPLGQLSVNVTTNKSTTSDNHLPKPNFNQRMDKMNRFLNNLRTPEQMRRMSDESFSQIDGPFYGSNVDENTFDNNENLDDTRPQLDEDAAPGGKNLDDTEPQLDKDAAPGGNDKNPTGIVHFGNLGFMNFIEPTNDKEKTGINSEDERQANKRVENETTPVNVSQRVSAIDITERAPGDKENDSAVVGSSRRRVFGSPKKQTNTTKSLKRIRVERVEKIKKNPKKNFLAAKKGFKANVITVKFKLSEIQVKAGQVPDFALFVKNDVHDHKAPNAANHAGKYISYVKGDIADIFYNQGISYNPKKFYMCENELDLDEDKLGPLQMTKKSSEQKSKSKKRSIDAPITITEDDDTPDDTSENSEEEEEDKENSSSSYDTDCDIFNMRKVAKVVSWGAPDKESSESSGSSGGVIVYGRSAEKSVDKRKKKKKADMKKRSKESNKKTSVDVLDSLKPPQKKKRPASKTKSAARKDRGTKRGRKS